MLNSRWGKNKKRIKKIKNKKSQNFTSTATTKVSRGGFLLFYVPDAFWSFAIKVDKHIDVGAVRTRANVNRNFRELFFLTTTFFFLNKCE